MTTPTDLAALADAVREAASARTRRAQLDAQFAVADRLVATRRAEREAMQKTLHIEQADVRRLEGVSPTRLWAALRGNTQERLAVEQAEADAASRALAAAQERLDHATADAERLRVQRSALRDVDRAYAHALAGYEKGLRDAGAPEAGELAHVAERLGEIAAESREIDEAARALQAARTALSHALSKLDSAGGWSTYDTLFGGGMIADLMKHSRIDEATAAFTQVNRALESLATELADIDAPAVRGVAVSDTLAVFDVLFDNILSDWMVRDRIARARSDAHELGQRLTQLAQYLNQRAADAAGVMAALTQRREAILTAASH